MSLSRWHMNRMGLVDFWCYENEVFEFENGHMLLRGSNGSGKSVTMQSFIPLLLDGNKSSERLDTFGTRSRKMETYLIDENSLVLLDELGSGTDPNEGAALAYGILEFIKKKNSAAIITTHLGELKTLKYKDPYFENATVLFDIATLKPKYNLIIGISGTSNAIDISQELGLNPEIIKIARENLISNGSESSKMFLEIEKKKIQ